MYASMSVCICKRIELEEGTVVWGRLYHLQGMKGLDTPLRIGRGSHLHARDKIRIGSLPTKTQTKHKIKSKVGLKHDI